MGLSKNVFYSKYLLLFAILMEEIMINYSILTCSAFPNKQCFVRFPIASWRQWGSITRLYVFRQRHDEADCSTNWIYIHICIIYTVYIYRQHAAHAAHAAHAPSSCTSPQSLFHIQLWNPQTLVWTCIFLKNLSMTIYICIHVYIYKYIYI